MKKHKIILEKLIIERKSNDRFCDMNNCPPTLYMEGSNKIINEMIKFIKKL